MHLLHFELHRKLFVILSCDGRDITFASSLPPSISVPIILCLLLLCIARSKAQAWPRLALFMCLVVSGGPDTSKLSNEHASGVWRGRGKGTSDWLLWEAYLPAFVALTCCNLTFPSAMRPATSTPSSAPNRGPDNYSTQPSWKPSSLQ